MKRRTETTMKERKTKTGLLHKIYISGPCLLVIRRTDWLKCTSRVTGTYLYLKDGSPNDGHGVQLEHVGSKEHNGDGWHCATSATHDMVGITSRYDIKDGCHISQIATIVGTPSSQ